MPSCFLNIIFSVISSCSSILHVIVFLQVSPPKPCMCLCSRTCVTSLAPIASSLIWSPFWCKESSTNHEAPHYEVSSAGYSRILSASALLIWRTKCLHPYSARGEISSLYYGWIFKETSGSYTTSEIFCPQSKRVWKLFDRSLCLFISISRCHVLYRRSLSHRQCHVQAVS